MKSALCLDLGNNCGWAYRSALGLVSFGTETFELKRWEGGGMRFLRFEAFLTGMHETSPIDAVFYEEVRRHVATGAAHVYGGFQATLTAWCEKQKLPYAAVPVGTIKKHATGKGNASKDAMIAAMVARGHVPQDDNQADALALLEWAVAECLVPEK